MAVTQHRHRQDASIFHGLGKTQVAIGGIRQHIWDLHDGAAQDCASCSRVLASWPRKHPPKGFKPFGCEAMRGTKAKMLVVESPHEGKLPLAYPRRVFRDGIKYWLDIMRRDRDDAQDFCGCCL